MSPIITVVAPNGIMIHSGTHEQPENLRFRSHRELRSLASQDRGFELLNAPHFLEASTSSWDLTLAGRGNP